ncbi:MAG: hypothetical protein GY940_40805, partial [bacterium]|nr:hypothetical protein [bacterium]
TGIDGTVYRRHGKGLSSCPMEQNRKWLETVFNKNVCLVDQARKEDVMNSFRQFLETAFANRILAVYIGRFTRSCGYHYAAKGYCEAIRAVNIPVLLVDIDTNDVVEPDPAVGLLVNIKRQEGELIIRAKSKNTNIVTIFHDTPDRYPQLDIEGSVRRIGFHVFETESYPVKWFKHAIEMD